VKWGGLFKPLDVSSAEMLLAGDIAPCKTVIFIPPIGCLYSTPKDK
jgi:hypothetical protein